MSKKRNYILPLFIVLILLSTFLVYSAETTFSSKSIVSSLKSFVEPIISPIFGANAADNLFEYFLFAMMIIAICYMALENTPIIRNNAFATWTITIAIAILSIRYIASQKLIQLLLLPQGVFGIAIITALPLVIYFWFVEFGITSRILRKMAWAIYAAVWLVIWVKQVLLAPQNDVVAKWGFIYLLSVGISIAIFVFDGTLQGLRKKIQAEKALTHGQYMRYSHLLDQRDETFDAYSKAIARGDREGQSVLKTRLENLENSINEIFK